MVDRFRLFKKAFIVDKRGSTGTGSEKEVQKKIESLMGEHGFTKAQAEEEYAEIEERAGRGTPRSEPQPSVARPSASSSGSSGSKAPAAMGVYIVLAILSVIGLILKNSIGYSPAGSLFISFLLGIFFFIAVHYTPEPRLKITLVGITFALDTFAQSILGFFPESELRNWVITLHVFAWVALSIVLFLMGVFDRLGAGEKLPWWAWLLTAGILGFILIYMVFPFLAQGPLLNQDKTHAEYFNIAKEQLAKVGKNLQETKNTGTDYFSCTFRATSAAIQYDKCLEEERIARYCKAASETAKEQQDCVTQQKELLAQGARPGVAGSVSDAIKEVTKVELKEDEYFPKRTTEVRKLYPVTLSVQNPREQTFGAQVSCKFTKGKEDITGKIFIDGQEKDQVQISAREQQVSVGCQPSADLKGKYNLEYSAVLSGMQTFSFLKRAFVSKEADKTVREQIETDNFKGKERASQGPAEFALLNFKFGTGEGTEPLVLAQEPVTFSFSVADINERSGWQVLKVNSYSFSGLGERGFSVDEQKIGDKDCLQGGEIRVSEALTKKREPSELKRCFLTLPPDLHGLKGNEFKVETFVADMNYDYKITKSISNIEVTPLTPELVS